VFPIVLVVAIGRTVSVADNDAQARQVVKMLLEGRLVCHPFEESGEIGYTFTATGTYRRLGVPLAEPFNVGGDPGRVTPAGARPFGAF